MLYQTILLRGKRAFGQNKKWDILHYKDSKTVCISIPKLDSSLVLIQTASRALNKGAKPDTRHLFVTLQDVNTGKARQLPSLTSLKTKDVKLYAPNVDDSKYLYIREF